MPEQVPACPLCGSAHGRLFDRRDFRGHAVENRLCLACGFVYQSPRMTAREADTFYEAEYRRMYQGGEGPSQQDLAVQAGRARSLAGFVHNRLHGVARHLDIGCSAGILLRHFQDVYGCQAVGIEPGKTYRKFAQKSGLRVYASLEEMRRERQKPFDLISMAHVLEHLPDPVPYLADLREAYLTKDGWLLLEVPNLYAHDSFEVAHLVSFSVHTLRQAVCKAGFHVVLLEAHGRPRSSLVPYYLTLLGQPAPHAQRTTTIQPEKGVAFKRRAGLLRRQILARLFPSRLWKQIEG